MMSTTTGRRKRSKTYKERSNSKRRRKLEKQGFSWPDLPRDIVERIIGRLHWSDRFWIRAVYKAWSIPNDSHITTIDELPWAMKFIWRHKDRKYGECQLLDPFSRQSVAKISASVGRKKFRISLAALPSPCASVYGWILFKEFELEEKSTSYYFLYSPFTTEVIFLPELHESDAYQVATFSLNATSPRCVVFLLRTDGQKIYIKLCSAGNCSWKSYEFDYDGLFDDPVDAVSVNGVFYCVSESGQLGAFNVELKEWTILVDHPPMPHFHSLDTTNLITSNGDLRLLAESMSCLKLFKFDFSEMCWVYENSLNNHVLFIGCTSFSIPATGEASQLANTIFAPYLSVTSYGSTSPRRCESRLYRNCVEATKRVLAWIQPPLGGILRAADLINDV